MIEKGRRWYFNASLRFRQSVRMPIVGSGVPTDAVTGAGVVGIGSLYVNYLTGIWYSNTGTKAVPVWSSTALSGALTPTTVLASSSIKSSSGTGGVGYATGAGGTVAQATDKSTGVTLSKVCGTITLNNASLAAATIVSFVLTNTAIAAGDVLVLNHTSGGTIGSYTMTAAAAAGSATIYLRNATAGALAEAVVISFAVIKGVTA